ncbi:MAG: hypothetical protein JO287_27060 [Pseudonocardiales bacterium]|nr:hypothetical protein [Pseudonocardiales bacterium]
MAELPPLLSRNDDRSFLDKAQEGMTVWWKLMAECGTSTDTRLKPQVPAWAVNVHIEIRLPAPSSSWSTSMSHPK